ncbi:MAG: DUF4179 domain-containing protein [Lachnospiraceae bacterium]|nr:DUF4179 domain-containing protein [Lachnospiraceae bacterium]
MTGFDLNKALTDIDERYWDETDSRKTARVGNVKAAKGGKRRFVRVALVAACLVTLLGGTVAAGNKALRDNNSFIALLGSTGVTDEFEEAYIPVGITKEGDVKVTLENIIGDKEVIFCEFSTDIVLEDQADGFLFHDPSPVKLSISGGAVIPGAEGLFRSQCGTSPFCRDGKLWYLFSLYCQLDEEDSLADKQIKVTVTSERPSNGVTDEYVFEWTNNYNTRFERIDLHNEFEGFTITGIEFSLTQMEIFSDTAEMAETTSPFRLDYIVLDDGTHLYQSAARGLAVKSNGYAWSSHSEDNLWHWCHSYDLMGDFAEESVSTGRLVPYEKIVTVCINGTEIDIR